MCPKIFQYTSLGWRHQGTALRFCRITPLCRAYGCLPPSSPDVGIRLGRVASPDTTVSQRPPSRHSEPAERAEESSHKMLVVQNRQCEDPLTSHPAYATLRMTHRPTAYITAPKFCPAASRHRPTVLPPHPPCAGLTAVSRRPPKHSCAVSPKNPIFSNILFALLAFV